MRATLTAAMFMAWTFVASGDLLAQAAIDDLGLPEPESSFAPAFKPDIDPGSLDLQGMTAQEPDNGVRTILISSNEVGIYNSSAETLSFLLEGEKIRLDPDQYRVFETGAWTVEAKIRTGNHDFDTYSLSRGRVYVLRSSGGRWVFAEDVAEELAID